MADYVFREFKELKNVHIFYKGSLEKMSFCGHIDRSKYQEIDSNGPITIITARNLAAESQNGGNDICGRCVASLYRDDDIPK